MKQLVILVNLPRALVIGEHGENMLPLTRFATISGIPLPSILSKEKLDEIFTATKNVAAEVIKLKGATVHAPGNAISAMIESVVQDKKQVIPVSTSLNGEYGQKDVSIGVPAVIGKNGVEKIVELELNDEEKEWFNKGVDSVIKCFIRCKILSNFLRQVNFRIP